MGELVLPTLEIEAELIIAATSVEITLKSFDRIKRCKKLMLINLRLAGWSISHDVVHHRRV